MPGDEYLFIFDKDDTLVQTWLGKRAEKPSDQMFLPNVLEKCSSLMDGGHTLSVASNQGGVAFGYLTYAQAEANVRWVAQQIGAVLYEFCPYHPQGTVPEFSRDDPCRKPNPGMLQSLQARTGFPWHRIIFVGNGIEDWQAALMAGCQFVWANDFF